MKNIPAVCSISVCSISVKWWVWFGLASSRMISLALVLWGAGAIITNGYGIQGQNCVGLLQVNAMTAGLHYRNLILGVQCFKLIT